MAMTTDGICDECCSEEADCHCDGSPFCDCCTLAGGHEHDDDNCLHPCCDGWVIE